MATTHIETTHIETIEHDGWREIVLNRPERKNAIVGPLGMELAEAVNAASAASSCRVVLLRGAGGAFCSGLDLKAFNADPAPEWLPEFQLIWREAHAALYNCRVPIVGALERYAINGGAALALACDLLIAGETSFLQVGEVQIGMAAPYNVAWMNLRLAESTMSQIALIGDRCVGPELVSLGVAHRSVEDAQVLPEAQRLCTRMADFPEDGLRRVKAGIRARQQCTADEWFDRFTQADPVGTRPRPKSMKSL